MRVLHIIRCIIEVRFLRASWDLSKKKLGDIIQWSYPYVQKIVVFSKKNLILLYLYLVQLIQYFTNNTNDAPFNKIYLTCMRQLQSHTPTY